MVAEGQKVKVTDWLSGHRFKPGEIVTCLWFKGGRNGGDFKSDETGEVWAMSEDEFQIIEE